MEWSHRKVVTCSLEEESGPSLRAVSAKVVGTLKPKEWSVPSGPRGSQDVYGKAKVNGEL